MADISQTIIYFSLFISMYFEVFMLLTYIDKRHVIKREEIQNAPLKLPGVTIMIPCLNEESTISGTLNSLLKLNYPKDKLSIIVIDDGSTDNTQSVLKRFRNNRQIRILKKENGGKHSALNFGLNHVTTSFVGCLDADSFVEPNALKKIISHFTSPDIMAVTPAIRVYEPRSIIQLIQKVEYTWGIFLRKMLSYLGAIYITPGPFSIFRTRVFETLGGYRHAHFTEDFEITLRMHNSHMKIVNAHDAYVYTITPYTLRGLYKQRLRWTYGFLNNLIDYKHMLFRFKYGNIGLFILPMAIVSIFTALYFTGAFIVNAATKGYEQIEQIQAAGFSFSWPSFDFYFLNINPIMIVTAAILAGTITILFISRKMTEGRIRVGRDILYFLAIYAFIAPLWLSKALFSTVFARKITWR
jgi:biofilm PGA synthesis N-glycosyltransferase PgaC